MNDVKKGKLPEAVPLIFNYVRIYFYEINFISSVLFNIS